MGNHEHGDAAMLNDLISMMVTLEQDRARMTERAGTGQGSDGLLFLERVVNALVTFVTSRCRESRVLPSRVLSQLAEADPYTQLLGEDNEQITVATAVAVVTGWTGSAEDRARMIDDLSRALLDVAAIYSESIAGLFQQTPLRDEWRSTFAIFADDLRAAAQRMAA
jgi:hypothetical protein